MKYIETVKINTTEWCIYKLSIDEDYYVSFSDGSFPLEAGSIEELIQLIKEFRR